MYSLQLLLRPSPALLLLVLSLQLGTNKAQDNSRKVVLMNFQMPQTASANEEVTAKLRVETQLRECMVIECRLISNLPMEGPFTYRYTGCLCENFPRTFYWDFQTNRSLNVAAVVDITRQQGICPNNEAVTPITANRFYVLANLTII
ncbi:hypothetical protein MC885_008804 [Smutsia gigantea]|nr:hypothetical protein MC885_008804 [Smutsia gigantea]